MTTPTTTTDPRSPREAPEYDLRYPIHQEDGWWVVWSMPPRYVTFKRPGWDALERFDSYQVANRECMRRNLAEVIRDGIADQPVPWLARYAPDAPTYRQFYEERLS